MTRPPFTFYRSPFTVHRLPFTVHRSPFTVHRPMTTPMRRQYLALKKQFPDTILFFRLGDFYETFDRDAEIVAEVCDIVLTSRPITKDERVPLAGVPHHSLETHLAKLVSAGYKVAIAEQIGNKPPAGEKLVERVVRRVVTAGTLVEPNLLDEGRNNYLAAVVWEGDAASSGRPTAIGLAYADITTGEFAATQFEGEEAARLLHEELARLLPAEILVREEGKARKDGKEKGWKEGPPPVPPVPSLPLFPSTSAPLTALPAWQFELEAARQALREQFGVESLAAYGCEGLPLATRAAGAIVHYLRQTQRGSLPHFTGLRTYSVREFMTLDEATRRNLELTQTIRTGSKKGSLLDVLDATRTPMGSRLLRRWIHQPLLDLARLNARLDAVQAWYDHPTERAELRSILRQVGDLERWTNRAAQGIARPQDLVGIRQALRWMPEIERLANRAAAMDEDERPAAQGRWPMAHDQWSTVNCADVLALLEAAIADEPPATLDKGGVIRKGYSAELDGIEVAARDARQWVAGLERRERERTGIKSLKVGFNKVFGYYIEVTTANSHLVPADYLRKQTLVNAERYITPELKEYESLILNAEERQLELEAELYRQVQAQVAAAAPRLLRLAEALAELDVYAALAEVAANHRYVRPELADDGVIEIIAGRHPVVEQTLREERFQPNDVRLTPEEAILIITGPNMSGKSTYLRQTALIALMAQIGSFVPADRAHIGLVDRIFTRIGAQDEIHAGQSTFMVEMVEAANILHHATSRSLIIFDELGRGTSTYDGLSIAWAVVEYIHNHPRLRAKTLFATHYHELTELAERLPHVVNYNVAVAEEGDTVVFLHKIVPGAADKSYGIHVAQLAGLPKPVIHRAEEILAELEAQGNAPLRLGDDSGPDARQPTVVQLSLFGEPHPVVEALRRLDINALTPLEALNKLYELQKMARR
ncbi:MAG: DNA mismatch repair protein MutS [Caldilineales bacterium]|nr:DNA mismatch repair protein MutS [Caldilineales bacterium]MDW8318997.1 DNA mismatch repair protein MutS [Anaerolineae bacterium]